MEEVSFGMTRVIPTSDSTRHLPSLAYALAGTLGGTATRHGQVCGRFAWDTQTLGTRRDLPPPWHLRVPPHVQLSGRLTPSRQKHCPLQRRLTSLTSPLRPLESKHPSTLHEDSSISGSVVLLDVLSAVPRAGGGCWEVAALIWCELCSRM